MIAPRVNAAGRMDDARKAVQMFVAETYEAALKYAEMLHADIRTEKKQTQPLLRKRLQLLKKDEISLKRKSTVVFNHIGIKV